MAKAPTMSPPAIFGRMAVFCAGEPAASIASAKK
jgi:hypothetical protein